MPKVTVRMKLKLKNTEKVIVEGWDPGVVVMQDVTFDFPDDYKTNVKASMSVDGAKQDFLYREVEIVSEEIPTEEVKDQNENL